MTHRSHRVGGLLALAVLTTALCVYATPGKAYADECALDTGLLCGALKNSSNRPVRVSDSFCEDGYKGCGPMTNVPPGQKSPYADTDGFYIEPGCRYSYTTSPNVAERTPGVRVPGTTTSKGSGWKKIDNNQTIDIVSYEC